MAYNSILDINEILSEYSSDIQEAITNEAVAIATEGMNTLKITSPKSSRNSSRKGKYAKGWRVNTVKGNGFVNCVIHNKTDYQLTHLLENEHLTHNGGKFVPKQKHIQPVHDYCIEKFESNVEKIIKNGG
jgi:hypothetical protein